MVAAMVPVKLQTTRCSSPVLIKIKLRPTVVVQ